MSTRIIAVDEFACNTADKFTKLYYDAIDRKRNKMNFLYVDTATLVWNGNVVGGAENIAKFYESLPNSTHTLSAIDCQCIDGDDNNPSSTQPLVVHCAGNLVLGQLTHAFTQTLILILDDDKYKIMSDRFRFID